MNQWFPRLCDIKKENSPGTTQKILQVRETIFVVILGIIAVASIVGCIFGKMTLSYMITLTAMPMAVLLAGLFLWKQRLYVRLRYYLGCLMMGAFWGIVATLVYDAFKPAAKAVFGYSFDPYRAMPVFGRLVTGLPSSHSMAVIVGWMYHFWIGAIGGMLFALFRPRGGALAGLLWAWILQAIRMVLYPGLLRASLQDPEFVAIAIVGFGLWGVVLGAGLKLWRWQYA